MAGGLKLLWGSVALGIAANSYPAGAVAENLRDPTRPALYRGGPGVAGPARPAAWVLQSVLISPERRYAIINGEVVSPGESIDGAQLLGVTEGRATLRTPEGVKTLDLFPDVAGRPSRGRAASVNPDEAVTAPSMAKKPESGKVVPPGEK